MENNEKLIEEIIQYITNKMPDNKAAEFKRKLKGNARLKELYALLSERAKMSENRAIYKLSQNLNKLAEKMFLDFIKGLKAPPNQGINVYDSEVIPQPSYIRPSIVDTRRLKYKFDSFQVEIVLYPISIYSFEIVGQMEDLAEEGNYTIRLKNAEQKVSVEIDSAGIFIFRKVSAIKGTIHIFRDEKELGRIELDL